MLGFLQWRRPSCQGLPSRFLLYYSFAARHSPLPLPLLLPFHSTFTPGSWLAAAFPAPLPFTLLPPLLFPLAPPLSFSLPFSLFTNLLTLSSVSPPSAYPLSPLPPPSFSPSLSSGVPLPPPFSSPLSLFSPTLSPHLQRSSPKNTMLARNFCPNYHPLSASLKSKLFSRSFFFFFIPEACASVGLRFLSLNGMFTHDVYWCLQWPSEGGIWPALSLLEPA